MTIDFNGDPLPITFTGEIPFYSPPPVSIDIKGPSVWLGEMSTTGSVPSGDSILSKSYAF